MHHLLPSGVPTSSASKHATDNIRYAEITDGIYSAWLRNPAAAPKKEQKPSKHSNLNIQPLLILLNLDNFAAAVCPTLKTNMVRAHRLTAFRTRYQHRQQRGLEGLRPAMAPLTDRNFSLWYSTHLKFSLSSFMIYCVARIMPAKACRQRRPIIRVRRLMSTRF